MKLVVALMCCLVGIAAGYSMERAKRNAALCTQADFDNGIYHVAHPVHCHRYYHCSAPGVEPSSESCIIGNFFDPVNRVCAAAADVSCVKDKCKGDETYDLGPCGAYCKCKNGKTTECMCCPDNQRFESTKCVAGTNCIQRCAVPPTTKRPCTLSAKANDNTKYVETLADGSTVERNCAIGSTFVAADCGCTGTAAQDPVPPPCGDSLHLPFDSNVNDVSNRVYIVAVGSVSTDPTNVPSGYVGASAATFDGQSYLKAPAYTYGWYGDKFVVRFRFVEQSRNLPAGSKEQLVTNADANGAGSFSVYYQRNENRVSAMVKSKTVSVTVQSGGWKDVDVRYDGATITLTVDGNTDTDSETGVIPSTPVPLQIGGGLNGENFAGFLDEVKVFKCL